MLTSLHNLLGKQFTHLSEQIWRQSLWTVTSGKTQDHYLFGEVKPVFHMVTSWSPLSVQGVEALCSLCLWHPVTALQCD